MPGKRVRIVLKSVCALGLILSLLPHAASAAPNQKPVIVSYNITPSVAFTGQPVVLSVVATDADGVVVAYEWNFPDVGGWVPGTSSMMKVFDSEGTYHIGVRVKDDRGGTTSSSEKISITPAPPPPPPPPTAPPSPTFGSIPVTAVDTGRVTIRVSLLTGNIEIL